MPVHDSWISSGMLSKSTLIYGDAHVRLIDDAAGKYGGPFAALRMTTKNAVAARIRL
jgi:hypothetical protein